MKYPLAFVALLILSLNLYMLSAQDIVARKYSLQLDLGLSRTFHYNQPINLNPCIEGCFPENQKPRITPNIELGIYRDLNAKNSFKIGIGVSSYKFWEEGMAGTGGGDYLPFQQTVRHSFYNISAGFRHIFNDQTKVKVFFEPNMLYEIPVKDYYLLPKNGVAAKLKLGTLINLSNKWGLIAEGFYQSGITRYNERDFGKDYIPFAYGLQFGLNLKI